MDSLHIPVVIRESAPMHATRLDLVAANRRGQNLALASARQDCQEAFQAADDLLRALKRIQALPTNRKQEMRDWLADVSGGAIDQLRNVEGAIERDLDALGCVPLEPLDLAELEAFHASVDAPRDADAEESGW